MIQTINVHHNFFRSPHFLETAMASSHNPANASSAPSSPLLTSSQLRSVEKRYAEDSLMQKAGSAAFRFVESLLLLTSKPAGGSIVIVCGPGNNGGDGLTLACLLRQQGISPCVIAPSVDTFPPEAAQALAEFLHHGGVLNTAPPNLVEAPVLIIDALFGVGLNRAPGTPFDELIRWINATHTRHRTPVVSLDVPSGLASDTGIAHTPTVRATATLSFIALKPGLLTLDGSDHCGELHLATLDVAPEDLAADAFALDRRFIKTHLPAILHRRLRNVHKGTFGSLGILGGAPTMSGAPLLAGRAAARLGAGKVRVGFLGDAPSFDPGCPELMLHPAQTLLNVTHDAWIVGCGLGTHSPASEVLTATLSFDAPLLLDADALTLLGHHAEWAGRVAGRHAPTVLTPHPAEAARLLQCSTGDIQHDRPRAAREIARRYRAYTVLKGCGSVIADPDGSWCINTTGNPALAFGGSGDVLAGMIGALLAQDIEASHALRYAVCLHGTAADVLVERKEGPIGVLSNALLRTAVQQINTAAAEK